MELDWSPVANAAILLLAAVVATLRPAVVAFLRARAEEYASRSLSAHSWLLSELASEAVRAVEQLASNPNGPSNNRDKKQAAVNYVLQRAKALGLAVEPDVVVTLIEAAVYGEKQRQ